MRVEQNNFWDLLTSDFNCTAQHMFRVLLAAQVTNVRLAGKDRLKTFWRLSGLTPSRQTFLTVRPASTDLITAMI